MLNIVREHRTLVVILFATVSLLHLYFHSRIPLIAYLRFSDAESYNYTANSILQGRGYEERFYTGSHPTSWRPPLYATFLASLYSIGLDIPEAGMVNVILIGMTSVVTLLMLPLRTFLGRSIASLSVLAIFLTPLSVDLSTSLMSEHLWLLEVVLLFFILESANAASSFAPAKFSFCGFLYGISILTRTVSLFLLPAILPLLWQTKTSHTCSRRQAITLFAIFLSLTILPWTIRNWVHQKELILVNTAGSFNLFVGNLPEGVSYSWALKEVDSLRRSFSEKEVSDILEEKAFDTIISDPMSSLARWGRRLIQFYSGGPFEMSSVPFLGISLIWFACVLLCLGRKRNYYENKLPFILAPLSISLLHAVTFFEPRFMFVTLPFMVILSLRVLAGEKDGILLELAGKFRIEVSAANAK